MSTKDDGGQAFPCDSSTEGTYGMTLRDYFAGQALAGMCVETDMGPLDSVARDCYRLADAMLAERTK